MDRHCLFTLLPWSLTLFDPTNDPKPLATVKSPDMEATQSSKIIPILASSTGWDEWFMATKIKAITLDVWDYVDPSRDEPDELREPVPADATTRVIYLSTGTPASSTEDTPTPSATSTFPLERGLITEEYLTTIERERLAKLEKKYERIRKGLNEFTAYLATTVATQYMQEAVQEATPYRMMTSLKRSLCPDEYERKYQLRAELTSLEKPRRQELDRWISDWVQLARKFKNHPTLDVEDVKIAFLKANEALDEVWAKGAERDLRNDFNTIADDFRSHYRRNPPKQSSAAFQTPRLQGRTEGDSSRSNSRPRKGANSGKCLCEGKHDFKDCYYLFPHKKPESFRWQKDVQEKTEANLKAAHRNVKTLIWHLRHGTSLEKMSENPPASFMASEGSEEPPTEPPTEPAIMMTTLPAVHASASMYALKNSWISDNGGEVHVTNCRQRMLTFKSVNQHLLAGDTTVKVKGIGTSYIWLTRLNGERFKMLLKNTLYSPNFHTNIVSLRLAKKVSIFFDTETNHLRYNGKVFAVARDIHNMTILEYNPLKSSGNPYPGAHENSEMELSPKPESGCSDPLGVSLSENPSLVAFFSNEPFTNPRANEIGAFHIGRSRMPKSSARTTDLWHKRLAHINKEAVGHLPKVARGIEITDVKRAPHARGEPKKLCEMCQLARAEHQISRRPAERLIDPEPSAPQAPAEPAKTSSTPVNNSARDATKSPPVGPLITPEPTLTPPPSSPTNQLLEPPVWEANTNPARPRPDLMPASPKAAVPESDVPKITPAPTRTSRRTPKPNPERKKIYELHTMSKKKPTPAEGAFMAATDVKWIPTAEIPADGLTKHLTRQKHEAFVKLLGMVNIKPPASCLALSRCRNIHPPLIFGPRF